jgi:hypothetical protein
VRRAALASVLGAGALIAVVLTAISACLPDLTPIERSEASAVEGLAAYCGDGLIETLDDGGDAGESCDPGKDAGDVPGCVHCQVVCPEGAIDDAGGHCYFKAGPASSFDSAGRLCQAQRAHLVTLASQREASFARGVVGDGGFWVGLAIVVSDYKPPGIDEPGFPHRGGESCPGCFGQGVDDGGFPLHHSVTPGTTGLGCLASENDRWFQVPCDGLSFETLCEREAPGQRAQYCLGPFCTTLPATAGSKRYLINIEPATADFAIATCKQYANGSLVTFATREEREQLAREIATLLPLNRDVRPDITVWIGLGRDAGTWTWDDGVDLADGGRPLPWGGNEPAPPGAGADRAYLRISDDFDTQLSRNDLGPGPEPIHPFVCERPAPK